MTIAIYLSAIILGFYKEKLKWVTAYIFFVMVFLAGCRTGAADDSSYVYEYYHVNQAENSAGRYVGYKYLVKLFSDRGLSFEAYKVILYAMMFLLLIYSIKRLTDKVNTVLALYMIFPYAIDVIQMKSFVAHVFAFYGISILIHNYKNRKNVVRKVVLFVIIELIAGSMHFSAIYYLFAGIYWIVIHDYEAMKRWIFVTVVTLISAIYLGVMRYIFQIAIRMNMIGALEGEYMERYYVSVHTRFGALIPATWTILMLYYCTRSWREMNTEKVIQSNGEIIKKIGAFMLTSAMLIPFFMIYIYLSRLLRVYMLLMYLVFAERNRTAINRLSLKPYDFAFIGSTLVGLYMDEYMVFDNTLGSLLRNNVFLP